MVFRAAIQVLAFATDAVLARAGFTSGALVAFVDPLANERRGDSPRLSRQR